MNAGDRARRPPQTPLQERIHGLLPVRFIPRATDPEIFDGIASWVTLAMSPTSTVLPAPGWLPGTRLAVSCASSSGKVDVASAGPRRPTR
ncbi:hypothetical protein [Nocardia sp. XZ_19_231]|uniref:hypothetical protein n=1 Tax=Nocardia sp. XZ_19_231 TaxID=2769252 RepID=UPI00188F920F|nr:hypothetical protein [Nocardia sp. XZ_19_231]